MPQLVSSLPFGRAVLWTSLLLASSCTPQTSVGSVKASPAPTIPVAELPVPHWTVTEEEPVRLAVTQLEEGELALEEAHVGRENVVLRLVERTPSRTTLAIESKAEIPLKFDLFISPDKKRYVYTSSCPTGVNLKDGLANYETWPHAIAAIAIGNVRRSGNAMGCH